MVAYASGWSVYVYDFPTEKVEVRSVSHATLKITIGDVRWRQGGNPNGTLVFWM